MIPPQPIPNNERDGAHRRRLSLWRRPTRTALVAALASISVLAVAGCGETVTATGATTTASKSEIAAKTRLQAYDAFVFPNDAQKTFEETYRTELNLLAGGDAAQVLTKMILARKSPTADVLFGVDTTLLSRAVDADLYADLPDDIVAAVPPEYAVARSAHVVPIDVGQVCLNVDAAWFAAKKLDPPGSFEDLVLPAYKDLLVVENPAASSPGLVFLAGTVQKMGDRWLDYWKDLKANGVLVAKDWSDAYEVQYTVSGGDRPIVVSYGSSPPAEVMFGDGKVPKPQSAVVESTCVEQVEYAGILAGASNQAGAAQLIRTMQSPEFQAAMPESNFVYPVDPAVRLPALFEEFAVRAVDPIHLDANEVAAGRDRWLEQWRELFG